MLFASILAAAGAATLVRAQDDQTPPSTFPKVYPNQPSGDLSAEWQSCT